MIVFCDLSLISFLVVIFGILYPTLTKTLNKENLSHRKWFRFSVIRREDIHEAITILKGNWTSSIIF